MVFSKCYNICKGLWYFFRGYSILLQIVVFIWGYFIFNRLCLFQKVLVFSRGSGILRGYGIKQAMDVLKGLGHPIRFMVFLNRL